MERAPRLAHVGSVCVAAVALALAAHAALPEGQGVYGPREALASAGVSAKFDDGFYDKVQQWIAAAASPPALVDHGNGTATLTVDGSAAGEYLVELSASDAHGEEWDTYLIRVAPAAGSP